MDLLIAEEEEAILLEERRLGRTHLAVDSQTPGTGHLGREMFTSLLCSKLDPLFTELKEEPWAPEREITVPPPSPLALVG